MRRYNHKAAKRKLASCLITGMVLSSAVPAIPAVYAEETETAAEGTETAESRETAESGAASEAYASDYDPSLLRIDETMYVNLDYYGAVKTANVVKGISSSKNVRYQDYGSYTSVLNMSNDEALDMTDRGVAFNLPGNGKKFFFQGGISTEGLELPWNVKVDYKLNGVPVEAEKLAGASGTIEVHVTATPNEKAPLYQRNNMLLTVVIPADKSVYSIDAPGSQTQSIGDVSGAAFTALPAEEKEFTARLGAEDYESVGVIVMMMPATLDSFDNITDIKDLKDTWKDSGDAMYDGLNSLLSATSSLREEMDGLSRSLNSAESARQKLAAARPGVFSATDEALASVMDMSTSVQKMIPYLSTAQTELAELNGDLNDLVDTLGGMTDSLHTLYQGLNRLEDGAFGARYDMSELSGIVSDLEDAAGKLGEESGTLSDLMEEMLSKYTYAQLLKKAGLTAEQMQALLPVMEEVGIKATDSVTLSDLENLMNALAGQSAEAQAIAARLQALYQKLADSLGDAEVGGKKLVSETGNLLSDLSEMLSGAGKTSQGMKYTADDLRRVIERTEQLNETLNVFYPDMQGALSESQSLLDQTAQTLNSSTNALSLAHEALKASADDADSALSQSIQSSLSMIEKSMTIFDALDSIQDAGAIAKDALDSEVDKFEDENRFLEMDPEAEKLSFTSSENREPDSLQIVLRTDEIEKADDETELLDAETAASDLGLWGRIKLVFTKLIESVISIFNSI